ncbi:Pol polyprotein/retrotransposon [Rhizoctonia solani 123E]|uniref:Pol polyprotein/retrotransposon n=1 Tax=Rhizoctonia solani 123E TaxID=1423351 RepID=A0A074RHY5_9AGAM|nr:Pol polyprotein/retrotransposon [Rhizoctonia solani 123E]
MASPLPNNQPLLWRIQSNKYQSLIDGKDAYEQIWVEPEDVHKTMFTTPDGTMVSEVMQQGDTNAGATYQSLMNVLLAEGIGKYWDVFLDDIIVYTDTVEEDVQRMKDPKKMQFLAKNLHVLGHYIDEKGIKMDPDKVDNVMGWKVPTSKDQIQAFLGAVGYLAPNCEGIRIPMGVLTQCTAGTKPWKWDHTAQRAFDEVKATVHKWRDHHRVAINYAKDAPPINLTTDASCTGASGVVSQGEDLHTAPVIAFWSGKFTSAQQNYPVHEMELLAIKESLNKFRHLLYTDHKSLEHFKTQRNLSGRQMQWSEVFGEFDYKIKYIPGETNKLADALSWVYEGDAPGTVRAASKYITMDDEEGDISA